MGKAAKTKRSTAAKLTSMTGFGKGSVDHATAFIEVEVKTLNSRFLDFNFKLPKQYNQFEADLRDATAALISRGRIEITVSRKSKNIGAGTLQFNRELFDLYHQIYRGVFAEMCDLDSETRRFIVRDIMARKDVLDSGEVGEQIEEERAALLKALRIALDVLYEMRKIEGERLCAEIVRRIDNVKNITSKIKRIVTKLPDEFKQRLAARLKKIEKSVVLDESRLATEVVMLIDKLDVSEELVRLESHFKQFGETLMSPPNGRKLDFLLQEIGREFNTIASKAQDAAVQALVVDVKTDLEKVREQLQNVE